MALAASHFDEKAATNELSGNCNWCRAATVLALFWDKLLKLGYIHYDTVAIDHVQIGGSNWVDVGS